MYKINKKNILNLIIIIFILNLYQVSAKTYIDCLDSKEHLEIHFIDVGHGDCILIKYPNKKYLMIDSGKSSNAQTIIDYLKKQNIQKIDYFIASHYDADHIGGFEYIFREFKITNILGPKVPDFVLKNNDAYKVFISTIQNSEKNINYLKAGDCIKIGNVNNFILSPIKESYSHENDYSVVLKVVYNDFSALLTGDLQLEGEKEMLKRYSKDQLKSNIYKVGHHGYKGSCCTEFLKAVNPDFCIISSGTDWGSAKYSLDVVDNIKRLNYKLYTTADNGNIVVYVYKDGKYNLVPDN